MNTKNFLMVVCVAAVLTLTICAESKDVDIIKYEIKNITQSDGPRGIVLFFDSMADERSLTIDAKADEPSDFVDTIAAIAVLDQRLARQNIHIEKYTVEYSGIYIPSADEFDITSAELDKIAAGAKNTSLVESVIARMMAGDFGENLKFLGVSANNHYLPSSEKRDMYLEYEEVPDLTIRIIW